MQEFARRQTNYAQAKDYYRMIYCVEDFVDFSWDGSTAILDKVDSRTHVPSP